jgi:CRP/FNR family transcriptional regulator, cyclic AMP receptor protein
VKKRFEGESGRGLLIDALKDQKMVGGNAALAAELAGFGELVEVPAGGMLIEQGCDDNAVYLVLAGQLAVVVNGRQVATRHPGDHVGEMAAILPAQRRSATVIASELSAVLRFTEPQLAMLGQKFPDIYRAFAKELARRLMQRNHLVTATREKIKVFIVSSAEALEIARTIQACFDHDPFTVTVWTDGVFRASHYPIETLEKELDQSDFAIAIAQPDDATASRGAVIGSPRDNVIFELGFFMGRLGRHRTLLLEPRGEEVRLPSDLSGITTISYRNECSNLSTALGPACHQIRQIIKDLGPNN